MDTLTNEEISLLNSLTEQQKTQALNLYASREKKTSTAYIFWILFSCHYFYLGKPVRKHGTRSKSTVLFICPFH